MKLKLTNKTRYDTRVLRRIILRGIKEEAGDDPDPRGRAWPWKVTVQYNRRHWSGSSFCGGYAWYNSRSIVMKPPHHFVSTLRFAQVLIHEIGHCLNLRHGEMVSSTTLEAPWLEDMDLPSKLAVKPKKTKAQSRGGITLQERRAENARAKLAEWKKKARGAASKVKAWQKKVKYYERALAKKAACPNAEDPTT